MAMKQKHLGVNLDIQKLVFEFCSNDYTNLNIQLIEKYNLDLKIFYNDITNIEYIIKEIPLDKLNILVDKQD